MKNILKLLAISLFINCSSQSIMNKTDDAKTVFADKAQFVGKPLKFLLSKINVPIQAVNPIPNKNPNEISTLYLIFAPISEYRKTYFRNPEDRPLSICIVFNQNPQQTGNKCIYSENPTCFQWIKQDEENLGDLVVYDLRWVGK